MGVVNADIELINGGDLVLARKGYIEKKDVKHMKVKALVDSGAYMLAINENVKVQLGLEKVDEQVAELADGQKKKLEVVGPVEIRFKNRRANVDAIVLPGDSEILLGAIHREDMDVLIDPKKKKLIVNPESPYLAKKSLK